MDHSKNSYEDQPRLKKKQSWVGGLLRNVVVQGALTAKAAVDAVRDRIDGRSKQEQSNGKIEDTSQQACPTQREPQTPRHRRTISARSALSSVRAHYSRRSLDHKRHSISDLLRRSDSQSQQNGGPETFYTTPPRKNSTMLAATIPLPSSPIVVPGKAPSLSLEFGPIQLMSPRLVKSEYDIQPRVASDFSTLPPLRLPVPLAYPSTPIESLLPDPLQPIAEVRRERQRSDEDNISTVDLGSPLPGTNAHMDLDGGSTDAAAIKEPDSLQLEQFSEAFIPSIETMATMPALRNQRSLVDNTSHTAPEHRQAEVHDSSAETPLMLTLPLAIPAKSMQPKLENDAKTGFTKIENHGPPSPDRCVRLPIRTKISIEHCKPTLSLPRIDSFNNRTPPVSLKSSPEKRMATRTRRPTQHYGSYRGRPDVAAAILRERTDDQLDYLERMNAAPEADVRARPSPASTRSKAETSSPIFQRRVSSELSLALSDTTQTDEEADLPALALERYRRGRTATSSPPDSSPATRFSPTMYRDWDQDSATLDSVSDVEGPHREATHNRFALLADLDDVVSDEEDDDDLSTFRLTC